MFGPCFRILAVILVSDIQKKKSTLIWHRSFAQAYKLTLHSLIHLQVTSNMHYTKKREVKKWSFLWSLHIIIWSKKWSFLWSLHIIIWSKKWSFLWSLHIIIWSKKWSFLWSLHIIIWSKKWSFLWSLHIIIWSKKWSFLWSLHIIIWSKKWSFLWSLHIIICCALQLQLLVTVPGT